MSVYRDTRRGQVQWRWRKQLRLPDGSRVRIEGTPQINTKAEAEKGERAHVERIINPPPAPPPDKPVLATLAEFSETFLTTYAKANKPSERASKRIAFRKHIIPALGHLPLDEIRVREVEALKSAMLGKTTSGNKVDGKKVEKPLNRKTVNNILAVLGKTLRHAVEIELLAAAPRIKLLKLDRQPFQFLDFEEYDALVKMAGAEPEWLAAVLLAGDAGLRIGEIRGLWIDDWERRSNQITVHRAMWRNVEGSTKGRNVRTIPLTARLAAALRAIRHLRGSLFLSDTAGAALPVDTMAKHLPRLCRRAGIKVIGWHALRHTFCSHLAMRGAPARTIQELAGHADLGTTMRYLHLTPGAKEQAIQLLDRRGDHVATASTDRDLVPVTP